MQRTILYSHMIQLWKRFQNILNHAGPIALEIHRPSNLQDICFYYNPFICEERV